MQDEVILVDGLSKSFYYSKGLFCKDKVRTDAVKNLSFSVHAGECVAFIGPNGAGKSTTVKLLTSVLYPTSGTALVGGLNPWENRRDLARRIGVVFGQRSQLWYHLPVRDSVFLLAAAYDIPDCSAQKKWHELSEVLDIGKLWLVPVKQLSLGQRMRCEIAASLLHEPSILFLDEPTIGLDVEAKRILRDFLKKEATENKTTILLTSHDTEDIEKVCQRVILINQGTKMLDTSVQQLKTDFLSKKYVRLFKNNGDCECFAIETKNKSVQSFLKQTNLNEITDITIENPPLEEIIRTLYISGERHA